MEFEIVQERPARISRGKYDEVLEALLTTKRGGALVLDLPSKKDAVRVMNALGYHAKRANCRIRMRSVRTKRHFWLEPKEVA